MGLYVCMCLCISAFLSVCVCLCRPEDNARCCTSHLSTMLFIYLLTYLSIYLSTYLPYLPPSLYAGLSMRPGVWQLGHVGQPGNLWACLSAHCWNYKGISAFLAVPDFTVGCRSSACKASTLLTEPSPWSPRGNFRSQCHQESLEHACGSMAYVGRSLNEAPGSPALVGAVSTILTWIPTGACH